MTHHATEDHHADHGNVMKAYWSVFVALCIFTAVSFAANTAVNNGYMNSHVAFGVILGVAIVKAALVCMIFMHLKWDWRKLWFMIAPAFILAPFLVLALLPDIVLAWRNASGQ